MKKIKIWSSVLLISCVGFFAASAMSTVSVPRNENSEALGIACKVYNAQGKIIAKCAICNCAKLAKGAQ